MSSLAPALVGSMVVDPKPTLNARSRSKPILILGAGLAGPAICLSLRSYGFPCRLLERRADPSVLETASNSDGGSITLSANSIRAVLQCAAGSELAPVPSSTASPAPAPVSAAATGRPGGDHPLPNLSGLSQSEAAVVMHEKLRAVGYSYDSMALQDDVGYRYGEVYVGEGHLPQGGLQALRIMRGDLRRLLLEECSRRGIEVEWGIKVRDVKEDEEGVELVLEDGTSISGSLLIGSDGIHSRVRAHILAYHSLPALKPEWSRSLIVNGFLPLSRVTAGSVSATAVSDTSNPFPSVTFSPAGFLMAIPINKPADQLAWGVKSGQQPERSRQELNELITSGEALRMARAEYAGVTTEPIRSLLDNVDEKSVNVWAPYGLPTLTKWHTRRAVVIGDAAHAMPPNGQGTAMAFEDAAYLGRLMGMYLHMSKGLDADQDVQKPQQAGERAEKVFAHWQARREKRTAEVKRTSGKWSTAPGKKLDKDGWAWWAKRWAMWLFIGVVKRGKVSAHGFSGFDVWNEDTDVVFA